jgi:hypothetical protein
MQAKLGKRFVIKNYFSGCSGMRKITEKKRSFEDGRNTINASSQTAGPAAGLTVLREQGLRVFRGPG